MISSWPQMSGDMESQKLQPQQSSCVRMKPGEAASRLSHLGECCTEWSKPEKRPERDWHQGDMVFDTDDRPTSTPATIDAEGPPLEEHYFGAASAAFHRGCPGGSGDTLLASECSRNVCMTERPKGQSREQTGFEQRGLQRDSFKHNVWHNTL